MKLAVGVLWLAYPLLVYLGLREFGVRAVAVIVLAFAALRFVLTLRVGSGAALRTVAGPFILAGGLAGMAAWLDDERFFLFLPSLVNVVLLFGFGRTLWRGTPMVETFARLQVEDLSPPEVSYCRTVTWVWCGFFAVNGATAFATGLLASLETWAIYNGAVAYLLVGGLYCVEFTYRTWRFRRYGGGVADPFFRRIFPPRQVL